MRLRWILSTISKVSGTALLSFASCGQSKQAAGIYPSCSSDSAGSGQLLLWDQRYIPACRQIQTRSDRNYPTASGHRLACRLSIRPRHPSGGPNPQSAYAPSSPLVRCYMLGCASSMSQELPSLSKSESPGPCKQIPQGSMAIQSIVYSSSSRPSHRTFPSFQRANVVAKASLTSGQESIGKHKDFTAL